MEDLDSARLRLACLELAKTVALATASGTFSILSEAERYWNFVRGEAAKPDTARLALDDIPF